MNESFLKDPETYYRILKLLRGKDPMFNYIRNDTLNLFISEGCITSNNQGFFKLTNLGHRTMKELKRLANLKKVTE